jgi:8-oxo-dGTP diphosphatase
MMKENRIEGVAAWLFALEQRTFLVGCRLGSHGCNSFASPGGHRENNEAFAETASRELLEETGLVLDKDKFVFVCSTHEDFGPEKMYVTHHMLARLESEEEATLREPEKCGGWFWLPWNQLMEKVLFLSAQNFAVYWSAPNPAVVLPLVKTIVVLSRRVPTVVAKSVANKLGEHYRSGAITVDELRKDENSFGDCDFFFFFFFFNKGTKT